MRHKIGVFLVIMGAVTGLVALVSVFNTAFDLNLGIGARGGSKTPLPDEWVAVAALAVAGAFFAGLGGIIVSERVAKFFRDHRAVRWGVPLVLIVGGYIAFVQIRYAAYGGKLGYAAAQGDTETVSELLGGGDYDKEGLDEAWHEAIEAREADTAALLAPKVIAELGQCEAFGEATWDLKYVQMLLDAGGDPSGCLDSNDYDLMYTAIIRNGDPERGQIVKLLAEHGVKPGQYAREEAPRFDDPELAALLGQ